MPSLLEGGVEGAAELGLQDRRAESEMNAAGRGEPSADSALAARRNGRPRVASAATNSIRRRSSEGEEEHVDPGEPDRLDREEVAREHGRRPLTEEQLPTHSPSALPPPRSPRGHRQKSPSSAATRRDSTPQHPCH